MFGSILPSVKPSINKRCVFAHKQLLSVFKKTFFQKHVFLEGIGPQKKIIKNVKLGSGDP